MVAGFEGSGTVLASGGGLRGRFMVGKRVAFYIPGNSGSWGEYAVVDAGGVMPLDSQVDFKVGSTTFVNPLTALAML